MIKNILLAATIVSIILVVYFGMNTYPDIKIFSIFGFQFGINYNEYTLLKLLTLCFGLGFLIHKYYGDK
jgi:hypothetical protein